MRSVILALALSAPSATDAVYEGTWLTTNRKLDGTMTCVVRDMGANQWRGRFFGVWEGVSFEYTVDFSGPPEKLQGKAVVDGADYEWTGSMGQGADGWLEGTFGGSRYFGSFRLKRKLF